MRTLVTGCVGDKVTIPPFYVGTYIMAAHSTVTHAIFYNDIDLWTEQARMSQHFAYYRAAK